MFLALWKVFNVPHAHSSRNIQVLPSAFGQPQDTTDREFISITLYHTYMNHSWGLCSLEVFGGADLIIRLIGWQK